MKLLFIILTFVLSSPAFAIDISPDPNNAIGRSLTGDRSEVQAAVPHSPFQCPGCIKFEQAYGRRLGDYEQSPESRGAFMPNLNLSPIRPGTSPSTDQDGSSDGTN